MYRSGPHQGGLFHLTLKFHQSGVCAFLQIGSSMGPSRHLALQRLASLCAILTKSRKCLKMGPHSQILRKTEIRGNAMTSFCNQHLLNNVPPEHRVEAHRDLPGRVHLCLNLYNPLLHAVQVKAGLTQEPHVFDDSISLRIVLAERLTKPAVQIHLVNMWGRAEVVAIELVVTLQDHLPVRPSAPD